MATVMVSLLKSGERIKEEVRTPLGGLLFDKGKIVTPKDIEILRAFLIRSVEIESKQGSSPDGETTEDKKELPVEPKVNASFHKEYDDIYAVLKQVFKLTGSGQTLPILEMRTQLEKLLKHIDDYNPLTFSPKKMSVDEYLLHNGIMVGLTSFLLARWHGLPQKDWIPLCIGGMLHDIGNVQIDEAILKKPSRLTAQEYEELKKHTIIGYNLLKNVAGLNEGVKLSILQHHERQDGSGYPLGVKGDKVHPYAKVIAVTDMFHAMTTNRQYKQASSPYLVLEELMKESFGKLDPTLVQTFIHKVTQFHHGTVVRLNEGSIGEIVFTDRGNPTRPMVNINGKIINLAQQREYFIQEVISN